MNNHTHKWSVLAAPDKLQCAKCDTVSTIDTLLANTATDAARDAKITLLSDQLFARELKKPAHDAAYLWVKINAPTLPGRQVRRENGVLAL